MYKKIVFVLILGLALVFSFRLGYSADEPRYYDPYHHQVPRSDSNPYDYDPFAYDYQPYGRNYPYGFYQQAPPWEGKKWQLRERHLDKEEKQLHEDYREE